MIKASCKSVSWCCEVLPANSLLLNSQTHSQQMEDSEVSLSTGNWAGKDRKLMNMSQANKQGPLHGLSGPVYLLIHTCFLVITSSFTVVTGALKIPKKQFSQIRRAALHTLLPLPPAFVGNIKLLQVVIGLNSKAKNLIQTLQCGPVYCTSPEHLPVETNSTKPPNSRTVS